MITMSATTITIRLGRILFAFSRLTPHIQFEILIIVADSCPLALSNRQGEVPEVSPSTDIFIVIIPVFQCDGKH